MAFYIDGLPFKVNETLNKLSDAEAGAVISSLMAERGWVGTYFQRGDIDSVVDREITDEEWERVQESWFWHKGVVDNMTTGAWSVIDEAISEAGLYKGDDDDDDE